MMLNIFAGKAEAPNYTVVDPPNGEAHKIVSAHGHESPVAAEVLVELVLERDEGLVAFGGEADPAQHGAGDVGSDLRGLSAYCQPVPERNDLEVRTSSVTVILWASPLGGSTTV